MTKNYPFLGEILEDFWVIAFPHQFFPSLQRQELVITSGLKPIYGYHYIFFHCILCSEYEKVLVLVNL